jgi:WD40 repeat protein
VPVTAVVASTPVVENVAQEITVRIEGRSSYGTGVIVERQGKAYYILTNAHVVKSPGTYTLIFPDGKCYALEKSYIRPLPGLDLALLPFNSGSSYRVAQIGNVNQAMPGQKVYVAGWTLSGMRRFIFFGGDGRITETNTKLPLGYNLSYNNLVRKGMSGGPVLDFQGRLLAINGLIRLSSPSGKIVASGIKISRFVNWRSNLKQPLPAQPQRLVSCPSTVSLSPKVSPRGANFSLSQTLKTGRGNITSLSLRAGGNAPLLISSKSDGTISLWNSANGGLIRTWKAHNREVNRVVLTRDGQRLLSGSEDGTIKIWEISTGKLVNTLSGHKGGVKSLALSTNGKVLASGSSDRTVKLWNTDTGSLVKTLPNYGDTVTALAFSRDDKILASGSMDGAVYLWNLKTNQAWRSLKKNLLSVLSVAISPDGKILAVGSGDGKILLWNLTTGQLIGDFRGHSDGVWAMIFAPDGKSLISGSWDLTIKLWDLKTGKLTQTLRGHPDYISAVAISPDGKVLVSGDWGGNIRLWRQNL